MIHDMDQNAFWSKKSLPLKILGQKKVQKNVGSKTFGPKKRGSKK